MTARWTNVAPYEPGRFWFRAEPDGKRRHHYDYGILLISWTAGHESLDSPPRLVVRTVIHMGGYSGECDYNGWSYGGGGDVDQWFAQNPGLQIWSEPVVGPPKSNAAIVIGPNLAFPPLPDKPAWTPPAPKPPTRCRCQGQKEHDLTKGCKSPAEEEREQKIADAKSRGIELFECPECSTLYEEHDLVKVRECSHCDNSKWLHSDGKNCPECNRPFSRVLTDEGCEDCHAECEKIDLDAQPKTRRRAR